MRKKLMMVGLALFVLCATTACGKKASGTIEEGLPENVQNIVDTTLNFDKQISTELNEVEELIDGKAKPDTN